MVRIYVCRRTRGLTNKHNKKVDGSGYLLVNISPVPAIYFYSTRGLGTRVDDHTGTVSCDAARHWPHRSFFHTRNIRKFINYPVIPREELTTCPQIPSHHPADAAKMYGGAHNHPLLIPLTTGFSLVAFISYNKPVTEIGSLGFFVFLGNGFLGLYGFYLVNFQRSS